MIGVQLTRKADGTAWTITGEGPHGWVVSPVDFGPAEEFSTGALAVEFDAGSTVADPVEPDEREGWQLLADANAENAFRAAVTMEQVALDEIAREDRPLGADSAIDRVRGRGARVEDVFRAYEIVNDVKLLKAFKTGKLDESAAVKRQVDRLLREDA